MSHDPVDLEILREELSILRPTLSVRIAPETPIKQVIQTMVEKRIGAVLIVENNEMTGIFSERDLIMKIAEHYDEVCEQPVQDFMTPNPVHLSIKHNIAYALNRMDVGDYRHIPITDENNYPTGIIAIRDIIRYIDYKWLGGPQ